MTRWPLRLRIGQPTASARRPRPGSAHRTTGRNARAVLQQDAAGRQQFLLQSRPTATRAPCRWAHSKSIAPHTADTPPHPPPHRPPAKSGRRLVQISLLPPRRAPHAHTPFSVILLFAIHLRHLLGIRCDPERAARIVFHIGRKFGHELLPELAGDFVSAIALPESSMTTTCPCLPPSCHRQPAPRSSTSTFESTRAHASAARRADDARADDDDVKRLAQTDLEGGWNPGQHDATTPGSVLAGNDSFPANSFYPKHPVAQKAC